MDGTRLGPGPALTRAGEAGAPSPARGPRTGVLGGSFNPAHGGHRRITLFAMAALGLDEVWWLVSPGNPLKPRAEMAPLAARFASALGQARRARIRVSAIEREFGTAFTGESLRALRRRWPARRFVWLMGADNLATFHRWHHWRAIARTMPIAVIARPGYDGAALASPAMAWFRRYRKPAASLRSGQQWSAPALVILRFDPDPRSATASRQADPQWADRHGRAERRAARRDRVTRRLLPPDLA